VRAISREKYEIVRDFARHCTASEFNPAARGGERRWKCYLPISNASSGWEGSDYAAHVAHRMNLLSQPPPKTSGNWQNSSRWHPPQGEKAVPPQSAQQNMYLTQPKRIQSNDFFNEISPILPNFFLAVCTRRNLFFRRVQKIALSCKKSSRSPKPMDAPFRLEGNKTDKIFAASDLVVFSAASEVNLCNKTDIYQRGSKPPSYS
jgi:hypothetical protein